MKTSVYVATDGENLNNIKNIIDAYNSGTVVPFEIVVSVFGLVTQEGLTLLKGSQAENVKFYGKKAHEHVVVNYNLASKLTSGDIIMYHDHNTLPSSKRVEMVQQYFEDNDILVAHHTYYNYDVMSGGPLNVKIITSGELYKRYFPFGQLHHVWDYARTYGTELNARYVDDRGVCVRKEVLTDTKWKEPHETTLYMGDSDGECYEFSIETLYKYNKSMIIKAPLTIKIN